MGIVAGNGSYMSEAIRVSAAPASLHCRGKMTSRARRGADHSGKTLEDRRQTDRER